MTPGSEAADAALIRETLIEWANSPSLYRRRSPLYRRRWDCIDALARLEAALAEARVDAATWATLLAETQISLEQARQALQELDVRNMSDYDAALVRAALAAADESLEPRDFAGGEEP